jgi:CheY-like chemotaxis protein|tara:strand:- start:2032 stop:3204 length:1173 start_codon:yes stop_codon:yes gene_type:complete
MNSTQEQTVKLKVLVVDDEARISSILKRIIEKLSCEVKCIEDGNQVGNALIAYEPDVIFLDLAMPGIDGVEVISGLGQAGCKSKIVLMSGIDKRTLSYVSEGARQNQLDVIDTITKPFALGQVEGILQPLIDAKTLSAGIQPISSFGPQAVFEPELNLDIDSSHDNYWVRANLVWRMDDGQIVSMSTLAEDIYRPKIAKGSVATLLRYTPTTKGIFKDNAKETCLKIPLPSELLHDNSTPDYLEKIVKQANLVSSNVQFEIDERVIVDSAKSISYVLSRLKIKGFGLGVSVKENPDEILSLLNKLPIDELTLNMADDRFRPSQIDDAETEYQVASFVSYVSGVNLVASVKNVLNKQQMDFAKRCKFLKASGRFIREPGSADEIREYFGKI